MSTILWAVIAANIAVLYGVVTASRVMAADLGTPRMQEIAQAVQEAALPPTQPPVHHHRHRRRGRPRAGLHPARPAAAGGF